MPRVPSSSGRLSELELDLAEAEGASGESKRRQIIYNRSCGFLVSIFKLECSRGCLCRCLHLCRSSKYSCRLGNFQAAQLDVEGLGILARPTLLQPRRPDQFQPLVYFQSYPSAYGRCLRGKRELVWFGGKRNWFLNFPSSPTAPPLLGET